MIKKIDHIVITTSDITKCFEFYTKLGFDCQEFAGRYQLLAGDFKINVHILGAELLPHATNVQTGSVDICFEITDNIYDFKSQLEAKFPEISLEIQDRNGVNGKMKSIYITDPDGNLLEFSKY